MVLKRILYWLVVIPFLVILPIFQSWDFLPEDGIWRIVKLTIAAAVLLIAILTKTRHRLHLISISVLIVLGLLFFA